MTNFIELNRPYTTQLTVVIYNWYCIVLYRLQLSIVLCKDGLIQYNLSYIHSGMETVQFKYLFGVCQLLYVHS